MFLIFLFKDGLIRKGDGQYLCAEKAIFFVTLYTCAKYTGNTNEKEEWNPHRKCFLLLLLLLAQCIIIPRKSLLPDLAKAQTGIRFISMDLWWLKRNLYIGFGT